MKGRMKVGTVSLALCLAVIVALCPMSAAAQSSTDCVTCANGRLDVCIDEFENPRGWAHWAWDMNNAGQTHIRKEGTHLKYYCFSCSVQHPPTCRNGNPNPPPLYEEEMEELLEAVAANDAPDVLRIALRQPEGSPIHFVPERAAVQVRACDERSVVVHIPLRHLAPNLAATFAAVTGVRPPPQSPAAEAGKRP